MRLPGVHSGKTRNGFTLVELMVSIGILVLIMVVLVQLTGQTSNTWRYTASKIEQFREARNGFETMTRRISQATLNTYWDYDNPDNPSSYTRYSELRFISGPMQSGPRPLDDSSIPRRPTHGIFFQAPFGFVSPGGMDGSDDWHKFKGLNEALNTWGYYIEVNDDSALRPEFLTESRAPLRIRSRLMEMMQPAGAMSIYEHTSGSVDKDPVQVRTYNGMHWFRQALASTGYSSSEEALSHPLAENIIALIILPKLSEHDAKDLELEGTHRETALAPEYYYHSAETGEAGNYPNAPRMAAGLNSKHQLPPVIQVTMVAIDETSAQGLNVRDLADDPLEIQSFTAFTKAADYHKDLLHDPNQPEETLSLEKRLIDAGMNYRIFTTNVILRGSKWSMEQMN